MSYYLHLFWFRFREPFSDFRATLITYILYGFFVYLLSMVWFRFRASTSVFTIELVFLYIGITEMLFMTFLRTKLIRDGTEDFSLSLARPRSWIGRELFSYMGGAFGGRLAFLLVLILLAVLTRRQPADWWSFFARVFVILIVLAPCQALFVAVFSSLRLSFPQTDYFVLPVSKVFLALGGVFGPLSDYGSPYREIFLQLPGSDLFFQPAHYVLFGYFFEISFVEWLLRIGAFCLVMLLMLLLALHMGKSRFQSWGG